MNFLENLPGGRAGEANRSDPQSGVSRLIPVNLPVPLPSPEIPAVRVPETLVVDRAVGHPHIGPIGAGAPIDHATTLKIGLRDP